MSDDELSVAVVAGTAPAAQAVAPGGAAPTTPFGGDFAPGGEGGYAAAGLLGVQLEADPFHTSTVPRNPHPEDVRPPAEQEAQNLAMVYQRMLIELELALDELESDQERLALLVQEAQGRIPPDEDLDEAIFLLRDGLELRLRELDEGRHRLAAVQRRLRNHLDDAEMQCELDALVELGKTDPRLVERLMEQRRVIRLQQDEMEQIYFERDVLADDAVRLREKVQEMGAPDEYADEDFPVVTSGPAWVQAAEDGELDEEKDPLQAEAERADAQRSGDGGAAREGGASPMPRPQRVQHAASTPASPQREDAAVSAAPVPEVAEAPVVRNRLRENRARAQGKAAPQPAAARKSATGRDFLFG